MNATKKVTSSSPKTEPMVLPKNATHEQLKKYFLKVFELRKNGDPFPIDLDEVWPLVYASKQNAKIALDNKFIEGEEFYLMQFHKVVLAKDLKNGVKYSVKLSVFCMEFLIARENPLVFKVYRDIFHNIHTPIHGVMPLYQNGVFGYPRKHILVSIQRSPKNGYRLKKKFPNENYTIAGVSCLSAKFSKTLVDVFIAQQSQLDLFIAQKQLQ